MRSEIEIKAIKNYIEVLSKDLERYNKAITENCDKVTKLQADTSYCNEMAERAEIAIRRLKELLEEDRVVE